MSDSPLPAEFLSTTRAVLGGELFDRYMRSFSEDVPVSIRLNPLKMPAGGWHVPGAEAVPWCRDGYWLQGRPAFTQDPLLHAGCYYVQEASSMFLDTVLCTYLSTCNPPPTPPQGRGVLSDISPFAALDLCAAPGGKSTLMAAALPADAVLYSNEPVRQRASILSENVRKWGRPRHIVTNNYVDDFVRAGMTFGIILCDVPCSGEGMFRKDPATRTQWSQAAVMKCGRLQRDIIEGAWQCLAPGGLMVYSTCTLNTAENEENVRWFLDRHADASLMAVDVSAEWGITGSLLAGFDAPVYRFIPGVSRGEGLFMCGIVKTPSQSPRGGKKAAPRGGLRVVSDNDDDAALLLLPRVDVGYATAISYLRREAVVLPDGAPLGPVLLTFRGQPLGPAKNIGTRANNLYPKEWKIRTTHINNDYEAILTDS